MQVTHMVRAGFVALALLVLPAVGTATAHAGTTGGQEVADVTATPTNTSGSGSGAGDTPWGP